MAEIYNIEDFPLIEEGNIKGGDTFLEVRGDTTASRVSMESLRADIGKYETALLRDRLDFVQGMFNPTGAKFKDDVKETLTPSTTQACTNLMRTADVYFTVPTGYILQAYYGNSSRERVGEVETISNGGTIRWSEYPYVRFSIRRSDGAAFSVNDVAVLISTAQDKSQDENISALQQKVTEPSAVLRNKEREALLVNSCRFRNNSETSKDLQLLLMSETRGDTKAVTNAIEMLNGFDTIDAAVHLGNFMIDNANGNYNNYINAVKASTKPIYTVIGNADVGNYSYIGFVIDNVTAYSRYIRPMYEKGWLDSEEHQEGKCYYYHDFHDRKVRLIVPYEFDVDVYSQFDDTYWEMQPYDSSAPTIQTNKAYSPGDVVNCHGWKTESFVCKQALTTESSLYLAAPTYLPHLRGQRNSRIIQREQLLWLCATLASTPSDYDIIIATHQPIHSSNILQNCKFSQYPYQFAGGTINTAQGAIITHMNEDLFGMVAAACNSKGELEASITFRSPYNAFVNDYTLNYSFAGMGAKIFCFLNGHTGRDFIWQSSDKNYISVNPISSNANRYLSFAGGDVRKSATDGYAYDCLTVASFHSDENSVSLVRLGTDSTDDGKLRDYEEIDINNPSGRVEGLGVILLP